MASNDWVKKDHCGDGCPGCANCRRLGPLGPKEREELEHEAKRNIKEVAAKIEEMKASNPKDAIGTDKMPLHLWPMSATVLGCLGLLDGMLKYGRANWREAGVRASIYYDALLRHWGKWFEGEDVDEDSGLPHESHVLACIAIVVDAKACGKFIDDRQYPGGFTKLLAEMTPHVKRLKVKHAAKNPHHYTIQDAKKTS